MIRRRKRRSKEQIKISVIQYYLILIILLAFLETVKMRSVSSKSDSLKQPLTSMEAVSFIFIRTRFYGAYT